MKKNKVIIIGRPNTGKSTLFNKIIGKKRVFTSKESGTTRDIISKETSWQGVNFQISDSGGLDVEDKSDFNKIIQSQTARALEETDLVLFLVNVKEDITTKDQEIAKKLKSLNKNIILAANKCDNEKLRAQSAEFYKLGLGKPLPISAVSGVGVGDLLDKIAYLLKDQSITHSHEYTEKETITISILGKPNVGKSSLFNALCGEEKVIVSDIPGTTRDSIDTSLIYKEKNIILTDTAGLRRKVKIKSEIEKHSSKLSLEKITKSDICLLVLSADEKTSRQDLRIASQILKNNKSIIIIVNKWDKIESETKPGDLKEVKKEFKEYIKYDFNSVNWAPIVFTSAKNKKNINSVLEAILEVNTEKNVRIEEKALNTIIKQSSKEFFKQKDKKIPKFNKFVQSNLNSNSFNLYVNNKKIVPKAFLSSLAKIIRRKYGFLGTPININLKSS